MMKKTFTKLFVAFLALLLAPNSLWAQDGTEFTKTITWQGTGNVADVTTTVTLTYTVYDEDAKQVVLYKRAEGTEFSRENVFFANGDWNSGSDPNSSQKAYTEVRSDNGATNGLIKSSLTIPETVDGYTVIGLGANALNGFSNITSLALPATCKTLGYYALGNTSSITSLELPEGLEIIGYGAIRGQSLSYISIPSTVRKIASSAFRLAGVAISRVTVEFKGDKPVMGGTCFRELGGTSEKASVLKLPSGNTTWGRISKSWQRSRTEKGYWILPGDGDYPYPDNQPWGITLFKYTNTDAGSTVDGTQEYDVSWDGIFSGNSPISESDGVSYDDVTNTLTFTKDWRLEKMLYVPNGQTTPLTINFDVDGGTFKGAFYNGFSEPVYDFSGDVILTGNGTLEVKNRNTTDRTEDYGLITLRGENTTLTIDGNDGKFTLKAFSPQYASGITGNRYDFTIYGAGNNAAAGKLVVRNKATLNITGNVSAVRGLKSVDLSDNTYAIVDADDVAWTADGANSEFREDNKPLSFLYVGNSIEDIPFSNLVVGLSLPITDNDDAIGEMEVGFSTNEEEGSLVASVSGWGGYNHVNVAIYDANKNVEDDLRGKLTIPSIVKNPYDKRKYTVNEIIECGLFNIDYITSLELPATITTIGSQAIANCENLTKVKFNSANPPTDIANDAFHGIGSEETPATLDIPQTWVPNGEEYAIYADWAGGYWTGTYVNPAKGGLGFIINGTNISSDADKDDLLGDNSGITYDEDKATLTIPDNTALTTFVNNKSGLKVVVGQNVTITVPDTDYDTEAPMTLNAPTTITSADGNGSLTISGGWYNISLANATLTTTNVNLATSSSFGVGINGDANSTIVFGEGSNVNIDGGEDGEAITMWREAGQPTIHELLTATCLEGYTWESAGLDTNPYWTYKKDDTALANLVLTRTSLAEVTYGLTVAGVEVTNVNSEDILSDNSNIAYDASTNTLTIPDGTNLDLSETSNSHFLEATQNRGLKIDVLGTATIKTSHNVINAYQAFTITSSTGEGQLSLESTGDDAHGINFEYSGADFSYASLPTDNITIEKVKLSIKAHTGISISLNDEDGNDVGNLIIGEDADVEITVSPIGEVSSSVLAYGTPIYVIDWSGTEPRMLYDATKYSITTTPGGSSFGYDDAIFGYCFLQVNDEFVTYCHISKPFTAEIADGTNGNDEVTVNLALATGTTNQVVISAVETGETATGTVVIPATVTASDEAVYTVTAIGDNAFEGQTNLTGVTLPQTLTSIGAKAFKDCGAVSEVTFLGAVPTISGDAFSGTTVAKVNYPAAAKSTATDTKLLDAVGATTTKSPCVFTSTEWTTLYSGMDFTLPDDVEAYIVTNVDFTTGKLTVAPTDRKVKANTALLLRKQPAGDDMYPITSFADVDISGAGSPCDEFKGNTEPVAITNTATTQYYILVNGQFVKATDGTLPAYKCYILSETSGAPALSIEIQDGETTGVGDVRGQKDDVRGEWYDLSGRRLQGKPTQKGVYIINGKKVNVK